ncbi:MAG: FkbM family methyltransferase [Acidobacteria bacterium]|nr:FkbM family methyltransferase [Acidobacteriota bacterium]
MELPQQTDKHTRLAERLTAAANAMARGRFRRTLSRPRKMVYPKMLQWAGNTTEVTAMTFWGEPILVILPELISLTIWRYGFFEEDVCRFMLRVLRPGMNFVDIGAHFGFFTRLGSYLVGDTGRVLSFEPTPNTFGQLMRNTVGSDNVLIHNCAAYSSETELTLRDFGLEYSAFNSAFGMREGDSKTSRQGIEFQTRARKVDDVIKERGLPVVDLVKIDAESSELHVLQGMTEIIKRDQPRIILETGDFGLDGVPKTAELIGWLRDFGYEPFEIGRDNVLRPAARTKFDFVGSNLLFSVSGTPSPEA